MIKQSTSLTSFITTNKNIFYNDDYMPMVERCEPQTGGYSYLRRHLDGLYFSVISGGEIQITVPIDLGDDHNNQVELNKLISINDVIAI